MSTCHAPLYAVPGAGNGDRPAIGHCASAHRTTGQAREPPYPTEGSYPIWTAASASTLQLLSP
eukprot:scaffold3396_cov157-Isochrysis_galbana.AAC.1